MPRTRLDLRHRLDKDGQRYGKIIDWKVSEMRAVELLEDLCDAMEDYTLVLPSSTSSSSSSSEGGETASASSDQAEQQPAWVKYRGDGSVWVNKAQRPEKAEEQLRIKQLKTFCGMLLESHEEEVVETLVSDGFAGGVTPVLCQKITSRCPDKTYESQDLSSSEQQEL